MTGLTGINIFTKEGEVLTLSVIKISFTSILIDIYQRTFNIYSNNRPRHKQPLRIYGLPKIQKADEPFRPIESCFNTLACELSAYLANILSPLIGNSDSTVTNSVHFVSTISSEATLDTEIMASVLPRRVAVYQRSYRRRRTSFATETV